MERLVPLLFLLSFGLLYIGCFQFMFNTKHERAFEITFDFGIIFLMVASTLSLYFII